MGANTARPAADPPSGSTGPRGPTPLPGSSGPRQRAGFSVFFDVADTGGLETRIYHEETGDEVVIDGAEPSVWAAWIRDRLASHGAPTDPVVDAPMIVDLDATLSFAGPEPRRTRSVRIAWRSGPGVIVERDGLLGAAFLRAIAEVLDPGSR